MTLGSQCDVSFPVCFVLYLVYFVVLSINVKCKEMKNYKQTFDRLWDGYITLCPSALKIQNLLQPKGKLVNDHIAFRTLDDSRVGIKVLASHFEELGYTLKGQYHFEDKKLNAIHLEHVDPLAPKVFISELISSAFSDSLQSTLKRVVNEIPEKWLGHKELVGQGRL